MKKFFLILLLSMIVLPVKAAADPPVKHHKCQCVVCKCKHCYCKSKRETINRLKEEAILMTPHYVWVQDTKLPGRWWYGSYALDGAAFYATRYQDRALADFRSLYHYSAQRWYRERPSVPVYYRGKRQ